MVYSNSLSDVHVFKHENCITCSLNDEVIHKLPSLPEGFVAEGPDAEKTMIGHLIWLRNQGVHIVDATIVKLLNEID